MNITEITKEYSHAIDLNDIEILIAHGIGKSREFVMAFPEYSLTKTEASHIYKLLKRRVKKEPISYIIGHKEFYGLDFAVTKHTLIPRPETELLVDEVLGKLHKDTGAAIIADIGTGSGNIAISIAKSIENEALNFKQKEKVKIFATDVSIEALRIAKKNAKIHRASKAISFFHGSLLTPIKNIIEQNCNSSFIIIVANLPYLSNSIFANAPADVRNYEPKSALYSPESGLQHYSRLLKQIDKISKSCSKTNLSCILEISPEQKKLTIKLVNDILPGAKISFKKDLAGKWRICIIHYSRN